MSFSRSIDELFTLIKLVSLSSSNLWASADAVWKWTWRLQPAGDKPAALSRCLRRWSCRQLCTLNISKEIRHSPMTGHFTVMTHIRHVNNRFALKVVPYSLHYSNLHILVVTIFNNNWTVCCSQLYLLEMSNLMEIIAESFALLWMYLWFIDILLPLHKRGRMPDSGARAVVKRPLICKNNKHVLTKW